MFIPLRCNWHLINKFLSIIHRMLDTYLYFVVFVIQNAKMTSKWLNRKNPRPGGSVSLASNFQMDASYNWVNKCMFIDLVFLFISFTSVHVRWSSIKCIHLLKWMLICSHYMWQVVCHKWLFILRIMKQYPFVFYFM